MRLIGLTLLLALFPFPTAFAEVTRVAVSSRGVVAGGQAFGQTGPYERIVGRIEFALDPAHPRNAAIVDLDLAPRGPDTRVHFSADLIVLQPLDPARGNGTLLFDIANRGRMLLTRTFNTAPAPDTPPAAAEFGDGFLMSEGYTLVWVGWQFDAPTSGLTLDAPRADLKGTPDTVRITFTVNAAAAEATPNDLPAYAPTDRDDPAATLTVRDRFWEPGTIISRDRWTFSSLGPRPRIRLEGGFEPGRVYELAYRSLDSQVAGVGLAAIRDAASAFRYRDDLPVSGRTTAVFGASQSGRFLRQFLVEGFNVDERDRRVFDVVWPHIAGAGLGSFNERFAMPGYSSFAATGFPFTDAEQAAPDGRRGGILAGYGPEHQPKVLYTNTSVEYWGQGRAAALTHTALDGSSDVVLPDNVRIYLLAGTQHTEGAFPPTEGAGQEPGNPTPQRAVMRALLRAMQRWVSAGTTPPASRYPRVTDGTLAPVADVRFPAIPDVSDPRGVEGPGRIGDGRFTPWPFLVPQVDADGNELAGIRVAELGVPLATTTGWNFRSERAGNPSALLPLAGSYISFARTRAEREARRDPRLSIEERYQSRDDFLQRIRAAASALVKDGYLLAEDVAGVVDRASRHWDYAAAN